MSAGNHDFLYRGIIERLRINNITERSLAI